MQTKFTICSVVLALLAGTAGIAYAILVPRSGTEAALRVPGTPERIARGRYIFENVSDCNGCHSVRDFSRFGGPVAAGGKGKGQELPGLPFPVVAPNITPDRETGIGSWSDSEKIRAIREGIGRDGRVLFPMMPYEAYRHMSDYDVQSLVAYLDTLSPARNALPRTQPPAWMQLSMRIGQKPVRSALSPERDESPEYGSYLVAIAGCSGCHTPREHGRPKSGMRFAGGEEFRFPFGTVASANITPDLETGIGNWSKEYFVTKFRQHANYGPDGPPKAAPGQFTVMPWLGLARLDVHDLAAVYNYLQAQQAVHHKVDTHPLTPGFAAQGGLP